MGAERIVPLAHELAAALYLASALVGWTAPARARRGGAVTVLLALGAAAHVLGMVHFHRVSPPVQLDSFPAALSLIGWLLAGAYLLALAAARIRAVGPQVGGLAFAFTFLADLGLRFAEPRALPDASAGAWPHAHVLLATAGFSLLALSSLGGLGYLTKERALKSKRPRAIELPSLESLDRIEHLGLVLGFPLLTLGVATGFVWAARSAQSPWTGHALFLIGAWAVYLVPLALRLVRRERGPLAARSVVVGFLVLAISYLGVRLIGAA
jgi:ABC-type uncharacterized transport system permease subunit